MKLLRFLLESSSNMDQQYITVEPNLSRLFIISVWEPLIIYSYKVVHLFENSVIRTSLRKEVSG